MGLKNCFKYASGEEALRGQVWWLTWGKRQADLASLVSRASPRTARVTQPKTMVGFQLWRETQP